MQLSVAVTPGSPGTASSQFIVIAAGTPTKTGASVSIIVITWVAVVTFPQPSSALHICVIVPAFGQAGSTTNVPAVKTTA